MNYYMYACSKTLLPNNLELLQLSFSLEWPWVRV